MLTYFINNNKDELKQIQLFENKGLPAFPGFPGFPGFSGFIVLFLYTMCVFFLYTIQYVFTS